MTNTPTPAPPTDPAALARELAAEIHQADQDCEYRNLPTERITCILVPTLERLVRERDLNAALFRQRDGELQETLAQAVDIERERNSLRAQLAAAQSERHAFQMRAERAEAILCKAGRALTGSKHVTYEDLNEYLRKLEGERDAAQSAEREARALLEQAVGEMDRIAQIVDQEVDAPILDGVISKIRAHLARGAKGKPASQVT